jgi:single-strand DNA-binding protein
MPNVIRVTGNVGGNPEQKKAGDKTVVEFSLMCDEWYYDEAKKEMIEREGQWYRATIWKKDLGDAVFRTLKKGSRIEVTGHVKGTMWTDKEGKAQLNMDLTVEDVAHKLNRVENIVLKQRDDPLAA